MTRFASKAVRPLIQAISRGRVSPGFSNTWTWFGISTHDPRSYLPSAAPSRSTFTTTAATSGSASHRGPEGAASSSLSPATKAAPWVVQRSATAATGNQPANRHVTKYPTPSGCQCGRRRCIPQVFQKCLSPPETRLKSRAQETSNRPAISWTLH